MLNEIRRYWWFGIYNLRNTLLRHAYLIECPCQSTREEFYFALCAYNYTDGVDVDLSIKNEEWVDAYRHQVFVSRLMHKLERISFKEFANSVVSFDE